MRRIRTFVLTLAAAFTLVGCGSGGPIGSPSQAEEVPESGTSQNSGNTDVEIVTKWTQTDSPVNVEYANGYVRVIRVNGECFVETYNEYRGSTSIAPGGQACSNP